MVCEFPSSHNPELYNSFPDVSLPEESIHAAEQTSPCQTRFPTEWITRGSETWSQQLEPLAYERVARPAQDENHMSHFLLTLEFIPDSKQSFHGLWGKPGGKP
jgi:hypothetical protein